MALLPAENADAEGGRQFLRLAVVALFRRIVEKIDRLVRIVEVFQTQKRPFQHFIRFVSRGDENGDGGGQTPVFDFHAFRLGRAERGDEVDGVGQRVEHDERFRQEQQHAADFPDQRHVDFLRLVDDAQRQIRAGEDERQVDCDKQYSRPPAASHAQFDIGVVRRLLCRHLHPPNL